MGPDRQWGFWTSSKKSLKDPMVYPFIKSRVIALALSLGTWETQEWRGKELGPQPCKSTCRVDLAPLWLVCTHLQMPCPLRQGSQTLRVTTTPSSAPRSPHQASPSSLSRADLTLPLHWHWLGQGLSKCGLLMMHTRITWGAGEDADSLAPLISSSSESHALRSLRCTI